MVLTGDKNEEVQYNIENENNKIHFIEFRQQFKFDA